MIVKEKYPKIAIFVHTTYNKLQKVKPINKSILKSIFTPGSHEPSCLVVVLLLVLNDFDFDDFFSIVIYEFHLNFSKWNQINVFRILEYRF